MAALHTPKVETGWQAPAFSLTGTDGKTHTRDSVRGPNGLLVMFICNHCPFVKAVINQIIRDSAELNELSRGFLRQYAALGQRKTFSISLSHR
jgi:hypothetical protein